MRTDDPVILQQIQQLEATAEALRRICGFPTLANVRNDSTKATYVCGHAGCTYTAYEHDDLEAHLETMHP